MVTPFAREARRCVLTSTASREVASGVKTRVDAFQVPKVMSLALIVSPKAETGMAACATPTAMVLASLSDLYSRATSAA